MRYILFACLVALTLFSCGGNSENVNNDISEAAKKNLAKPNWTNSKAIGDAVQNYYKAKVFSRNRVSLKVSNPKTGFKHNLRLNKIYRDSVYQVGSETAHIPVRMHSMSGDTAMVDFMVFWNIDLPNEQEGKDGNFDIREVNLRLFNGLPYYRWSKIDSLWEKQAVSDAELAEIAKSLKAAGKKVVDPTDKKQGDRKFKRPKNRPEIKKEEEKEA